MAARARNAAKAWRERYEENVRREEGGKNGLCRTQAVDVYEVKRRVEEQVEYLRRTGYEMRPLEVRDGRVW